MEQLLLHLLGDYIIQNDHVALNKKKNTLKGWIYCIWHCLSYSLPFLLITNIYAVAAIAITHMAIDKTNIVSHFLKYKNFTKDISNFGFIPERPFAISIWLNIYADNTIHLIGNYLIIKYIVT
jgi:hypothetical protein